jgi:hypothetical protein
MAGMEKKALDQPDETRTFDNGRVDLVTFPVPRSAEPSSSPAGGGRSM